MAKLLNRLMKKLEPYYDSKSNMSIGWQTSHNKPGTLTGTFVLKIDLPDIKDENLKRYPDQQLAETNPIYQLFKDAKANPTGLFSSSEGVEVTFEVAADTIKPLTIAIENGSIDEEIAKAKENALFHKTDLQGDEFTRDYKKPLRSSNDLKSKEPQAKYPDEQNLFNYLSHLKELVDNTDWNKAKDVVLKFIPYKTTPSHIDKLRGALKKLSPELDQEQLKKIFSKTSEIISGISSSSDRNPSLESFYKVLQCYLSIYNNPSSFPGPAPWEESTFKSKLNK